ncbi:YbaN family protein [Desulfosporosinus lacus]|uniref:YbaN family protein n=1 Tax=Desulfosporosinus lacus TaxID=329936 RepID=UPI00093412B9|nr:YbaN family protein [Desulfosporosinus lacus]
MIRFFWLTCGLLSLTIGFIGIFLPLIPTVPLVLFSAIAFAKSSQFLHDWLVNHKFFGVIIKDWQHNRKIPIRAKIFGAMAMIISITISIVYLSR